MIDWHDAIRWILIGIGIIVFVYAVARSFWWAYFRSKLEHFRAVMKEMKEKEND